MIGPLMRNKQRLRTLQGCPRCGSPWTKRAGLTVCANVKCGYCRDNAMRSDYGYTDNRPREAGQVMVPRDRINDPISTRDEHPRGRREQPLTGKGKR